MNILLPQAKCEFFFKINKKEKEEEDMVLVLRLSIVG